MNKFHLLIWDYTWWVYIVFPGYILIFFIITKAYDILSVKLTLIQKSALVCFLVAVDVVVFYVLAIKLRWI